MAKIRVQTMLDAAMVKRLQKIAQQSGRSVSNLIAHILDQSDLLSVRRKRPTRRTQPQSRRR